MPDVFIDQTILQLKVNTRISLTGATVRKILYIKPDLTEGFFPAVASGTFLTYNVQAGDISQVGWWTFQSYVEIGGEVGYGNKVRKYFDSPITP